MMSYPEVDNTPFLLSYINVVAVQMEGWNRALFSREAPYRKLQPMEIKTGSIADIRNQKTYFARAKKGMEAIENYAVKNAMVSKVSQIYAMSFDASRAIFNVSFLGLAKQCYDIDADTIMDQRRLGDITYLTFYDKIICDKKRKASSIDN